MKEKCPFGKNKCQDCVLYRKGLRYFDMPDSDGKKRAPVPFEACGVQVGVDCIENLIERSIGQQRAIEEVRNEINQLKALFIGLVNQKLLNRTGG